MLKKTLTIFGLLSILVAGILSANAQSIPTISPFKIFGGVISPSATSSRFKLDYLGGSGTKCLHTDTSGNIGTTSADCGSGGSISYGEIATISNAGNVTYIVATTSTDIGRGTALKFAVTQASAGSSLYLASSTYDIGTGTIDLYTKGLSLHGSGKYSTIIKKTTGAVNEQIIKTGSNTVTSDLTLYAANTSSFLLPWGNITNPVTNAILQNVYIIGTTDGVYFDNGDGYSAKVINVDIDSKWDSVYSANLGQLDIYNSRLTSAATSTVNSGHSTGGVINDNGGTINLYNVVISATGGSVENDGIHNIAAQTYVYGGSFTTSGTLANDLFVDAGQIYVTANTVYDTSKVSGTLNYLDSNPIIKSIGAGNVNFGIGTTNPTSKLQVEGDAHFNGRGYFDCGDSTTGFLVYDGPDGISRFVMDCDQGTATFNGTDLYLPSVGGSTFLALNASGKVIATTTPTIGGVTSVTGTYPVISSGGATPAISLAFSTSTSNTWASTQTFGNTVSSIATTTTLNVTGKTTLSLASSTSETISTNLYLPGVGTSTFLALDPAGRVIATTTPAGGGSGTISTSTALANTQIVYATGAATVGSEAAFTYNSTSDNITVVNASTSNVSITGKASVGTTSTSARLTLVSPNTDTSAFDITTGGSGPWGLRMVNQSYNSDIANGTALFATAVGGFAIYPNQAVGAALTIFHDKTITTGSELTIGPNAGGYAVMNFSASGADGIFRNNTGLFTIDQQSVGNDINIRTDSGVERFRIKATSGNIGINDTTPDFRLETVGTSSNGYLGVSNTGDGDIFSIISSGNVGIATTTPSAKLSITGTAGSPIAPVLRVASSTDAPVFTIDGAGNIITGGGTPTVSSCGVTPSISGNDTTGTVTVGTGVVTACTITFSTPKSSTPRVVGVVTGGALNITGGYSAKSTTAVTFSFAATVGSGTFDYMIIQ